MYIYIRTLHPITQHSTLFFQRMRISNSSLWYTPNLGTGSWDFGLVHEDNELTDLKKVTYFYLAICYQDTSQK